MKSPQILAALTVVFWSFSSALARLLTFSSPYLLFCFSFAFALIIYLVYARRFYGNKLLTKLKRVPPQYFLVGILGYYAIWLGNTESFLAYNSASETTVLNYTWLIFTVFFSQLIFNRPKKINTNIIVGNVGVLFCFLSVYVLAVEGKVSTFNFSNVEGLLWGLMGGMAYGFFSAYSSKVKEEDQPIFLLAAVSSSLLAMMVTFVITVDSVKEAILQISLSDVFFAFALGVLVDALGYIMWTRALQNAVKLEINISKIASIIFLLPLLSLLIVAIIFKEDTIFRQYFLFSILLLLIGIAFSQKAESISSYWKQMR
ncbi:MAG: DMT family transporter [Bacteroidota bacterium]|nr:DMT family transporter [Bacteroidota bacterium]